MATANTWKGYHGDNPKNADSDKNLALFSKATLGTESEEVRFQQAFEDPDCFIMCIGQVTGEIKFLHSLTNLGGTRSRPGNILVALEGKGPSATPVFISEESLKKSFEVEVPTATSLKSLSDPAQVSTAKPADANARKFNNANYVILPPFLSKVYSELDETKPAQLLIETNSAISTFDTTHAAEANFNKSRRRMQRCTVLFVGRNEETRRSAPDICISG